MPSNANVPPIDPNAPPQYDAQVVDDRIDDITKVAVFLVFLEREHPMAMWGGIKIPDVVEAFARLEKMNADDLRWRLLKDFGSEIDDAGTD